MNTWIGTSGFQYPEWKGPGKFYPKDLPLSKMLSFYAARFPATEINYTFRRIPSEKTIERWNNETPSKFRFCLKAPQKITHFAKLKDCRKPVSAFYKVISKLGVKLGPVLFQLPESFEKDVPRLRAFLKSLPKGMRAAFEFRNASWFDEEIFEILSARNSALCIAESEELLTPLVATADFGYLRLRRAKYPPRKLSAWAASVLEQKMNWKDCYVYFKHEETGSGPKFAAEFDSKLARLEKRRRK